MNIDIRNPDNVIEQGERKGIKRKVRRVFNTCAERVAELSITLTDINGLKGGVDKQCTVVIQAEHGNPVVVSETHTSVGGAIHNCLHRARESLKKQLKRKNTSRRRRHSLHQLALIIDDHESVDAGAY